MKFLILFLLFLWTTINCDVCPDLIEYCPGDETCCASAEYGFGCCEYPDATCCLDLIHCCPSEYMCVVEYGLCIYCPSALEKYNSSNKAILLTKSNSRSVCPGGQGWCPFDQTCCEVEGSEVSCCPLPNAVCCSDNIHCCPNGYSCNVSSGECTSNNKLHFPWFSPVPSKNVKNVVCPDGGWCVEGSSCCMMANGEYGCCAYPKAVCCSDQIHCCPSGTTCDVQHNQCLSGPKVIAWKEKKPAVKRIKH